MRLVWTDTGAAGYTLLRSASPDMASPEVRFQGADLETLDTDAVTDGVDYFYQVE